MKTKWMFLAVLSAVATAAVASDSPLLTKTLSDGLVPLDLMFTKSCEVYKDKVVRTTGAGALKVTRITAITLDGDVATSLAHAKAGKLDTRPAPTDGPITTWAAYDGTERVVLRARGSSLADRRAMAATSLVNLLDDLCGPSSEGSN